MAMKFNVKSRHAPTPNGARFWAGTAIVIACIILLFLVWPQMQDEPLPDNETENVTENETVVENATEEVDEEPADEQTVIREQGIMERPDIPKTRIGVSVTDLDRGTCDAAREYVYTYFVEITARITRWNEELADLKEKEDSLIETLDTLEDERGPSYLIDFIEEDLDRTQGEIEFYEEYLSWAREEKSNAKDVHDRIDQRCFTVKLKGE